MTVYARFPPADHGVSVRVGVDVRARGAADRAPRDTADDAPAGRAHPRGRVPLAAYSDPASVRRGYAAPKFRNSRTGTR